jgi:hypothetical protein
LCCHLLGLPHLLLLSDGGLFEDDPGWVTGAAGLPDLASGAREGAARDPELATPDRPLLPLDPSRLYPISIVALSAEQTS